MKDKRMNKVTIISIVLATLILVVGGFGYAIAHPNYSVTQSSQPSKVSELTTSNENTGQQNIEYLLEEAKKEAQDAAEDKAEAEYAARIGSLDAYEEALEAEESAREAAAAQKAYDDALASGNNTDGYQPSQKSQSHPQNTPTLEHSATPEPPNGGCQYGDDYYKQENDTVYEWDDDGYWEAETDKKIDAGVVYEYDDGYWEADKKVENGVDYEWDNGRWEVDEDDELDDDINDDEYDD